MRNEADRVKLTELVDDFSVGYRAQHDKKVTEMAVVKKQTLLKKASKSSKLLAKTQRTQMTIRI